MRASILDIHFKKFIYVGHYREGSNHIDQPVWKGTMNRIDSTYSKVSLLYSKKIYCSIILFVAIAIMFCSRKGVGV